jgi:hypothetical protein
MLTFGKNWQKKKGSWARQSMTRMCAGARLAVLLVLLSASAGADEPELTWYV